ncbi:MAG: hypothetical protein JWL95_2314 [Gemmatimonadetes bacterium]|nr:hypothetical protein [Gemmatimonadota bacterium]
MTRAAIELGATPVVVALPAGVEPPSGARVVRTPPRGAAITAMRLGMAQLTNSMAHAVLLLPLRGAQPRLNALHALLDASTRSGDAIIAFSDTSLDRSPAIVPRDAWLELVTLGEGGIDALSARRRVERIDARPT